MASHGADPEVEAGLRRFLHAQLPRATDLHITNLHRVPTGLSRENWPFDARWREDGDTVELALIMRRDPVGSVLETDRLQEFAVLTALEGSAVPAPRAHWVDAEGAWVGRPFIVMERLRGECDYFVLTGGRLQLAEAARARLARRFCEILAAIHRFDWRAAGLDRVLPGADGGAAAALDEWERYLDRQELEPQPELRLIASWLRRRLPERQATVLVHGDFKPGNALIENGDVTAMLDWELAHLGDPLEDIGWVTNPVRAAEHLIPGVWERADLYRAYEELTGFQVDEAAVQFWRVFANFKLATIALTGVRNFCEGRSDRVYSGVRPLVRRIFALMEEG